MMLYPRIIQNHCGFPEFGWSTLLIGVADDQQTTGIDIEINKFDKGSADKFVNRFKDVKKRISLTLILGCSNVW